MIQKGVNDTYRKYRYRANLIPGKYRYNLIPGKYRYRKNDWNHRGIQHYLFWFQDISW